MREVLIVGGEESLVFGNFRKKLRKHGLDVGAHIPRTSKTIDLLPANCTGIIVIRDLCSHSMSDAAKALAKASGVPYAPTSRKWSEAEVILRSVGLISGQQAMPIRQELSPPAPPSPVVTLVQDDSEAEARRLEEQRTAFLMIVEDDPEILISGNPFLDIQKRMLEDFKVSPSLDVLKGFLVDLGRSWKDKATRDQAISGWLRKWFLEVQKGARSFPKTQDLKNTSKSIFGYQPDWGLIKQIRAEVLGEWAADNFLSSAEAIAHCKQKGFDLTTALQEGLDHVLQDGRVYTTITALNHYFDRVTPAQTEVPVEEVTMPNDEKKVTMPDEKKFASELEIKVLRENVQDLTNHVVRLTAVIEKLQSQIQAPRESEILALVNQGIRIVLEPNSR